MFDLFTIGLIVALVSGTAGIIVSNQNRKKTLLSVAAMVTGAVLMITGMGERIESRNNMVDLAFKLQSEEREKFGDFLKVAELASTFTLSFDNYNLETYKAQYTFDGTFAIQLKDTDKESVHLRVNQMDGFFKPRLDIFKKNGDQRRHYITNVKVTSLDKNSAETVSNLMLLNVDKTGKATIITTGRYHITMKSTKYGWRLKSVICKIDKPLDHM